MLKMKFLVFFLVPVLAIKMVTWADQRPSTVTGFELKSLEEAVIKGDLNFVTRFFSSSQVIDNVQKNCLIRLASSKGQYDLVEFLLDNGVQRDPLDYALLLAGKSRNAKMIEYLKNLKIKPDGKLMEIYDLIYNSYHGIPVTLRFLLRKVDPTVYNNSALLAALKNGHYGIVKILMDDDRVSQSQFSKRILKLLDSHEYVESEISQADPSAASPEENDTFWSKICFWCCKNCKKYSNGHAEDEEFYQQLLESID